MRQILTDVMERLRERVTELRYVADDWGQMDFYEGTPPVKFPCALVSVSRVSFEAQTEGVRWATMTLLVRVADAPALSGTMAAPEAHKERALFIFDLIDRVGDTLHGMGGDDYDPMEQREVTHYSREDAVREYAMTFETRFALTQEGE